ncbi:MAG: NADPH-dependent FMN reductase [Dokdonella sp.]
MTVTHRSRHILALPGSLHRNGYNQRLLENAARIAPPGLVIDIYADLCAVPLFDEDLEAATGGGPDGVCRLRDAVAAADGVLIATPEYNQSLPGVLKNALDWLSRPAPAEVLSGKSIAITGASPGRWGTRLAQAALRQVLAATESAVMPTPMLFVRDAALAFDADGQLVDAATLASLRNLLDAFDRWIDRAGAVQLRPAA